MAKTVNDFLSPDDLMMAGPAVDAPVAHWNALDWHLATTWALPDFRVRRAAAVLALQTGA